MLRDIYFGIRYLPILASIGVAVSTQDYRVVCYYPNWSQYRAGIARYTVDQIDPWLCTHLVFAFAKIVGNDLATIEYNDVDMYTKMRVLRFKNPSLKLMLSVGGGTASEERWKSVSGIEANRKEFSKNAINYLRMHGFDGLDLDWEFPGANERTQFTDLVKEIRGQFSQEAADTNSAELLLSAAFGAGQTTIDEGYDLIALANSIDFANVMAYDLHGGWDSVTDFHSALYGYADDDPFSQEWVVQRYLTRGLPADKIVLGIPTYGRTFKLCDADDNWPRNCSDGYGNGGAYTKNAGTLAYYEICTNLNSGWIKRYDTLQQSVYAYSGDQWVSYADEETIKTKVEYVSNHSLSGVMFWDLSQDDFSNQCGEGNNPLIGSATKAFRTMAGGERASIGDYRLVCFYPNWGQYRTDPYRFTTSNIDPDICTHVIFAFVKIVGNDLDTYESNDREMYGKLNALKLRNPQLKTLLSVGGKAMGTDPFKDVSSNEANRKEFASNAVKYLRMYGFDGLDVSWSNPDPAESFTELLAALHQEFQAEVITSMNKDQLLLTATLASERTVIENSYEFPLIIRYLDFANIAAFDLHGETSSTTNFHSALNGTKADDEYSQSWVVSAYLSRGMPSHKLVLGIPTYGRTFVLCNPDNHDPRECSSGAGDPGQYTINAGTLAYYEICPQLDSSMTRVYDVTQQAVYAYSGNQWMSYEDPESIKMKTAFVADESLGGLMVWDLSQDDFLGNCPGGQRSPLIAAVRSSLEEAVAKENETALTSAQTESTSQATTLEETQKTSKVPTTSLSRDVETTDITQSDVATESTSEQAPTSTRKSQQGKMDMSDVKASMQAVVISLAVIGVVFLLAFILVLVFLVIKRKRAAPLQSSLAKNHLAHERMKAKSRGKGGPPMHQFYIDEDDEDHSKFDDFGMPRDFPPGYYYDDIMRTPPSYPGSTDTPMVLSPEEYNYHSPASTSKSDNKKPNDYASDVNDSAIPTRSRTDNAEAEGSAGPSVWPRYSGQFSYESRASMNSERDLKRISSLSDREVDTFWRPPLSN